MTIDDSLAALFSILCFLVLSLCILPSSAGIGLGASPSSLMLTTLAGGTNSSSILVSTNSQGAVVVEAVFEGPASTWTTIMPQTFRIRTGEPVRVNIITQPPAEAQAGLTKGSVTFNIQPSTITTVGISADILPRITIPVEIFVLSDKVSSCIATPAHQWVIEEGREGWLFVLIKNTGNTLLFPEASFSLWNTDSTSRIIDKSETLEGLAPGRTERMALPIPPTLGEGTYALFIEIPACNASFQELLHILQKGTFLDTTTFSLQKPPTNKTGILPWIVTINNNAPHSIVSHYEAAVYAEGKLVQLLQSPDIRIEALSNESITLTFPAMREGSYRVLGKIITDNRSSKEQETLFSIAPSSLTTPTTTQIPWSIFLSVLLLVSGIILLVLIHHRRAKNIKRRQSQRKI